MASTLTQSLFATTYKDDYRDSDHYHRILFNSGRALQARELTQMQTITQSEIARFARNLFKEGASVNPGGITLNSSYEFVKLNTAVNNLPGTIIVGNTFTGQTSGLRAEILEVVTAAGGDPDTLYVRYIGGVAGGVVTALRFTPGEDISDGSNTLTVQTTNTTLNPAVGAGVRISIGGGDFFTQGHFVFAEPQSILLNKYSNVYSGTVGFTVTEDIVTYADDPNLFDNQGAAPNTTAPGADRYRIRLELVDQSNIDSDETFIYFAKIDNSVIVNNATGTDNYGKINDLLAKRTKEESGDYIVQPFILKFDEDSDINYLRADISPGVAYINGYRVELSAPNRTRVQKPTATSSFNNQAVAASYGNYVLVSTLKGVPRIDQYQLVNLRSAVTYGGSNIGTARVRAVEEDGSNYRYYISDIKMYGANNFESVRSIGTGVTNYADLILENSVAVLKDASNNDLLFPLVYNRPKNLSDISLQVQKRFTTIAAGGTATLGPGLLSSGETWTDLSSWVIVVDSNGQNVSSTASVSGAGGTTATISGLSPYGGTINVLAYVDKSAGSVATKTIAEATVTAPVITDSNGVNYINLRKADVYDILRLRDSDSDGIDLTNYFRFDNGQRDNFYDTGKLVLKSTFSAPAGNVFARFRYFQHGAGDFFAATSYDSATTGLAYGEIPSFKLASGNTISLRDYLDFRPRIGDRGTTFDSATAIVRPIPKNGGTIRSDNDYYLPRYDKLVANENGEFTFIPGVPSFTPTYPETPANTLELYKIRFNANTINDSDLSISAVEHKLYTMADIGIIDKRVDRLEEYTTLSLLETNTSNWSVVDSTGLPRTKAGFLADGFADHYFSDITSQEYRASVDPKLKIVRPSVVSNNIRLMYDSSLSSNVILKGDNVYLSYVESDYIQQTFVSGTENINPFAVVFNEGFIELSPASDEWKDTAYVGSRVINGGTSISANNAQLFNEWQWQWQGLATTGRNLTGTILDVDVNRTRNTSVTSIGTPRTGQIVVVRTQTRTTVSIDRVVSDQTIRRVVGDRVVDVAIIPFMRSREVSFKATGLKPYQRYWPFFDDTAVSDWCRQTNFTRFATTSRDWGNSQGSAVGHPSGSTTLETDANGTIEGSFFIPNTPSLRFRTGTREFKLINVNSVDESFATSVARTQYEANGVLETRQQTVVSTRAIRLATTTIRSTRTTTSVIFIRPTRRLDPLAQTFVIDEEEGVFLTKVAVYFKSKPTGNKTPSPVVLEIRPVENGYPSSSAVVPGSMVVLTPNQVNTVSAQTEAGVLSTPTYFTFDEPVYLNGETEYCIVLLSDSNDYNVYVAQADAFVLGSEQKRIGRQPSMGSLFKSQNARTWEPDQTKDLTFKLYRANFSTAPAYAVLENVNVPLFLMDPNPIRIENTFRWATINHPNHGFDSGDTVKIYGLDSATTYATVRGTSILGARTVSFPDANGYQIYLDSSPTISAFVGGSGVLASRNIMYDIINPHIDTLVVPNTSISFESKLTTGRSLAGVETRFIKNNAYSTIALKEDNYSDAPLVIANRDVEVAAPMNGAKSATIKVAMSTTSSRVSPVIDLQRSSLILVNNLIDKQDSDRTRVGYNTPLSYKSETDPTDGSHVAKHVTVPVTLSDQAVGLQIVLSANRPADADFVVYYRTATSGQNIRLLPWSPIDIENTIPSDDNPDIYREYRYLVGGRNGTMTPFSEYQIKIVFRSTNSSKVPSITDLRVIALAD